MAKRNALKLFAKYWWTSLLLLAMPAVWFFISSYNTRNEFDDLILDIRNSDSLSTILHRNLAGQWKGFYEEYSYVQDTIYYGSYQEKLDTKFPFPGAIIDSSLVKEIKIKEKIKRHPVAFNFNIYKRGSDRNFAEIKTGNIDRRHKLKIQFPFLNYSEEEIFLKFGTDDNWGNSNSSYEKMFLHDCFTLQIETLTETTLVLKDESVRGRIFLKKTSQKKP